MKEHANSEASLKTIQTDLDKLKEQVVSLVKKRSDHGTKLDETSKTLNEVKNNTEKLHTTLTSREKAILEERML